MAFNFPAGLLESLRNQTQGLLPSQPMPPIQNGIVPPTSGANPFAQIAEQAAGMPQGFARPEAQQWMQQALSAPYMQGWGQPQGAPLTGAPGMGGVGGAGSQPSPTAPGSAGQVFGQLQNLIQAQMPSTGAKSREAITNFGSIVAPAVLSSMGGTAGALGGALGGASALGPIGAMLGIGASVIGQYSKSSTGYANTGIDESWFRSQAKDLGWQVRAGKGKRQIIKDGKVMNWSPALQQQMFDQVISNARTNNILPPKVKSHAGTQAYQALFNSGIFGPELTQQAIDKYGTGSW